MKNTMLHSTTSYIVTAIALFFIIYTTTSISTNESNGNSSNDYLSPTSSSTSSSSSCFPSQSSFDRRERRERRRNGGGGGGGLTKNTNNDKNNNNNHHRHHQLGGLLFAAATITDIGPKIYSSNYQLTYATGNKSESATFTDISFMGGFEMLGDVDGATVTFQNCLFRSNGLGLAPGSLLNAKIIFEHCYFEANTIEVGEIDSVYPVRNVEVTFTKGCTFVGGATIYFPKFATTVNDSRLLIEDSFVLDHNATTSLIATVSGAVLGNTTITIRNTHVTATGQWGQGLLLGAVSGTWENTNVTIKNMTGDLRRTSGIVQPSSIFQLATMTMKNILFNVTEIDIIARSFEGTPTGVYYMAFFRSQRVNWIESHVQMLNSNVSLWSQDNFAFLLFKGQSSDTSNQGLKLTVTVDNCNWIGIANQPAMGIMQYYSGILFDDYGVNYLKLKLTNSLLNFTSLTSQGTCYGFANKRTYNNALMTMEYPEVVISNTRFITNDTSPENENSLATVDYIPPLGEDNYYMKGLFLPVYFYQVDWRAGSEIGQSANFTFAKNFVDLVSNVQQLSLWGGSAVQVSYSEFKSDASYPGRSGLFIRENTIYMKQVKTTANAEVNALFIQHKNPGGTGSSRAFWHTTCQLSENRIVLVQRHPNFYLNVIKLHDKPQMQNSTLFVSKNSILLINLGDSGSTKAKNYLLSQQVSVSASDSLFNFSENTMYSYVPTLSGLTYFFDIRSLDSTTTGGAENFTFSIEKNTLKTNSTTMAAKLLYTNGNDWNGVNTRFQVINNDLFTTKSCDLRDNFFNGAQFMIQRNTWEHYDSSSGTNTGLFGINSATPYCKSGSNFTIQGNLFTLGVGVLLTSQSVGELTYNSFINILENNITFYKVPASYYSSCATAYLNAWVFQNRSGLVISGNNFGFGNVTVYMGMDGLSTTISWSSLESQSILEISKNVAVGSDSPVGGKGGGGGVAPCAMFLGIIPFKAVQDESQIIVADNELDVLRTVGIMESVLKFSDMVFTNNSQFLVTGNRLSIHWPSHNKLEYRLFLLEAESIADSVLVISNNFFNVTMGHQMLAISIAKSSTATSPTIHTSNITISENEMQMLITSTVLAGWGLRYSIGSQDSIFRFDGNKVVGGMLIWLTSAASMSGKDSQAIISNHEGYSTKSMTLTAIPDMYDEYYASVFFDSCKFLDGAKLAIKNNTLEMTLGPKTSGTPVRVISFRDAVVNQTSASIEISENFLKVSSAVGLSTPAQPIYFGLRGTSVQPLTDFLINVTNNSFVDKTLTESSIMILFDSGATLSGATRINISSNCLVTKGTTAISLDLATSGGAWAASAAVGIDCNRYDSGIEGASSPVNVTPAIDTPYLYWDDLATTSGLTLLPVSCPLASAGSCPDAWPAKIVCGETVSNAVFSSARVFNHPGSESPDAPAYMNCTYHYKNVTFERGLYFNGTLNNVSVILEEGCKVLDGVEAGTALQFTADLVNNSQVIVSTSIVSQVAFCTAVTFPGSGGITWYNANLAVYATNNVIVDSKIQFVGNTFSPNETSANHTFDFQMISCAKVQNSEIELQRNFFSRTVIFQSMGTETGVDSTHYGVLLEIQDNSFHYTFRNGVMPKPMPRSNQITFYQVYFLAFDGKQSQFDLRNNSFVWVSLPDSGPALPLNAYSYSAVHFQDSKLGWIWNLEDNKIDFTKQLGTGSSNEVSAAEKFIATAVFSFSDCVFQRNLTIAGNHIQLASLAQTSWGILFHQGQNKLMSEGSTNLYVLSMRDNIVNMSLPSQSFPNVGSPWTSSTFGAHSNAIGVYMNGLVIKGIMARLWITNNTVAVVGRTVFMVNSFTTSYGAQMEIKNNTLVLDTPVYTSRFSDYRALVLSSWGANTIGNPEYIGGGTQYPIVKFLISGNSIAVNVLGDYGYGSFSLGWMFGVHVSGPGAAGIYTEQLNLEITENSILFRNVSGMGNGAVAIGFNSLGTWNESTINVTANIIACNSPNFLNNQRAGTNLATCYGIKHQGYHTILYDRVNEDYSRNAFFAGVDPNGAQALAASMSTSSSASLWRDSALKAPGAANVEHNYGILAASFFMSIGAVRKNREGGGNKYFPVQFDSNLVLISQRNFTTPPEFWYTPAVSAPVALISFLSIPKDDVGAPVNTFASGSDKFLSVTNNKVFLRPADDASYAVGFYYSEAVSTVTSGLASLTLDHNTIIISGWSFTSEAITGIYVSDVVLGGSCQVTMTENTLELIILPPSAGYPIPSGAIAIVPAVFTLLRVTLNNDNTKFTIYHNFIATNVSFAPHSVIQCKDLNLNLASSLVFSTNIISVHQGAPAKTTGDYTLRPLLFANTWNGNSYGNATIRAGSELKVKHNELRVSNVETSKSLNYIHAISLTNLLLQQWSTVLVKGNKILFKHPDEEEGNSDAASISGYWFAILITATPGMNSSASLYDISENQVDCWYPLAPYLTYMFLEISSGGPTRWSGMYLFFKTNSLLGNWSQTTLVRLNLASSTGDAVMNEGSVVAVEENTILPPSGDQASSALISPSMHDFFTLHIAGIFDDVKFSVKGNQFQLDEAQEHNINVFYLLYMGVGASFNSSLIVINENNVSFTGPTSYAFQIPANGFLTHTCVVFMSNNITFNVAFPRIFDFASGGFTFPYTSATATTFYIVDNNFTVSDVWVKANKPEGYSDGKVIVWQSSSALFNFTVSEWGQPAQPLPYALQNYLALVGNNFYFSSTTLSLYMQTTIGNGPATDIHLALLPEVAKNLANVGIGCNSVYHARQVWSGYDWIFTDGIPEPKDNVFNASLGNFNQVISLYSILNSTVCANVVAKASLPLAPPVAAGTSAPNNCLREVFSDIGSPQLPLPTNISAGFLLDGIHISNCVSEIARDTVGATGTSLCWTITTNLQQLRANGDVDVPQEVWTLSAPNASWFGESALFAEDDYSFLAVDIQHLLIENGTASAMWPVVSVRIQTPWNFTSLTMEKQNLTFVITAQVFKSSSAASNNNPLMIITQNQSVSRLVEIPFAASVVPNATGTNTTTTNSTAPAPKTPSPDNVTTGSPVTNNNETTNATTTPTPPEPPITDSPTAATAAPSNNTISPSPLFSPPPPPSPSPNPPTPSPSPSPPTPNPPATPTPTDTNGGVVCPIYTKFVYSSVLFWEAASLQTTSSSSSSGGGSSGGSNSNYYHETFFILKQEANTWPSANILFSQKVGVKRSEFLNSAALLTLRFGYKLKNSGNTPSIICDSSTTLLTHIKSINATALELALLLTKPDATQVSCYFEDLPSILFSCPPKPIDSFRLNFTIPLIVPPEPVPQDVRAAAVEAAVATSAVSSVLGSPGLALQQMRLSSLTSLVACEFSHASPLEPSISIFPLDIGSAPFQFYRGGVLGNLLFVLGAGVLFTAAAAILFFGFRKGKGGAASGSGSPLKQMLLDIHMPGIMYIPIAVSIQGSVSASLALGIHTTEPSDYVWVIFGFLYSTGYVVLAGLYTTIWFKCELHTRPTAVNKPSEEMLLKKESGAGGDEEAVHLCGEAIFGSPQHWKASASTSNSREFKNMFHFLFGDYRVRYFFAVELLLSYIMGIIDGMRISDKNVCFGQGIGMLLVFLILSIFYIFWRPAFTHFTNGFMVLQNLTALASAIAIVISLSMSLNLDGSSTDAANDAAAWGSFLANAALFLGLLKFLIDFIVFIIWAYAKRKRITAWVSGTSKKFDLHFTEEDALFMQGEAANRGGADDIDVDDDDHLSRGIEGGSRRTHGAVPTPKGMLAVPQAAAPIAISTTEMKIMNQSNGESSSGSGSAGPPASSALFDNDDDDGNDPFGGGNDGLLSTAVANSRHHQVNVFDDDDDML